MLDSIVVNERERYIIRRTQIDFMPLKGSILKGYYPQTHMRFMSDIDVLILLDAKGDKLSKAEEDILRWPLYELELKTGVIISPLILSKSSWYNRPFKTPFYVNVMNEGIRL